MDGRYLDAKLRAKRMADAIPGGESLVRWYHKIGEVAKTLWPKILGSQILASDRGPRRRTRPAEAGVGVA